MTSDEALMLEFQGGSRAAFEELFARYRKLLYGDPKQEEPDRSAPPAVEVRISNIRIRPKGSTT